MHVVVPASHVASLASPIAFLADKVMAMTLASVCFTYKIIDVIMSANTTQKNCFCFQSVITSKILPTEDDLLLKHDKG